MIADFVHRIRSRIRFPFQVNPLFSSSAFSSSFLLSILIISLLFVSETISFSQPRPDPNSRSKSSREAMRVHPLPRKRNNITIRYAQDPTQEPVKRLRRLPHIFSRVLELPFKSDADVEVEENRDCFKFVAETEGIGGGEVRAHTVEIYPGVTRIMVRMDDSSLGLTSLNELELDVWRFRLPDSTRPDLVTAVYESGELIVTVPKVAETEISEDEEEEEEESGEDFGRGMGNSRLVLVQ